MPIPTVMRLIPDGPPERIAFVLLLTYQHHKTLFFITKGAVLDGALGVTPPHCRPPEYLMAVCELCHKWAMECQQILGQPTGAYSWPFAVGIQDYGLSKIVDPARSKKGFPK